MLLLKKDHLIALLTLFILAASAFVMRTENYLNAPLRTIDEVTYYHLAKNLLGNFPQYHTQEFVESLEKL
ncbi:MAG: hypothetical protein NUV91_09495, partial [Candidatus Omnitrophica bacterium]|nr:hypothetical protein [Candidatus Omnitrophota bacterium]